MKKYFIIQDNYIIGTANGKYKAVKYIEKILELNGYVAKWFNHIDGRISALVNCDLKFMFPKIKYTIEERR